MLESVSPYLLLRASIPKQNASATPYDLYSLAQLRSAPDARQAANMPSAPNRIKDTNAHDESKASQEQESTPAASAAQTLETPQTYAYEPQIAPYRPAIPARRTHYIADIKTRHSAAAKHTTFTNPSQS